MHSTITTVFRASWPVVVCLALGLLAPGCLFDEEVADGGACVEAEDCKSKGCVDGVCVGSRCESTEDHDACEPGWRCTYIPPSVLDDIGAAIGGVFGGDGEADGHHACRPTCGHCPATYHCGRRTDGLCDYGAPSPEVTLAEPQEVVREQPVRLSGSVWLERGEVIRYVWRLSSYESGATEEHETLSASLDHVFAEGGTHHVELVAHTDAGGQGSAAITVYAMGTVGDDCHTDHHCASTLTCSDARCASH